MGSNQWSRETQIIHSGEPNPRIERAVAMPVFQSATFISTGKETGYDDIGYARLSNTPNHIALHEKLATLEHGQAALVTSSGMAAITTSLITLAGGGGHVLAQKVLYGGTHDFLVHDAASHGIAVDFIENDPADWDRKLRPETRVIYVEAMSNPLLGVVDHRAVARFANEHGITAAIDNTFASPINFRPLDVGFHLSIHSATKYLNGHTDIIAGAMIGKRDLVDSIRRKVNHLGGSLDAHACFLLHRGLKTLALRVERQNANAMQLAKYLASHKAVAKVNYPGLPSHADHHLAKALFDGFGGMLSIEIHGGAAAADRLISRLQVALHAPSLGGVETLISRPALLSHVGLAAEQRKAIGVSDALVRVSVGIENVVDLIDDFEQALAAD